MRTVLIIVGGFVLLAVAALVARANGGAAAVVTAAKLFIAAWFLVAAANMWMGVARAGYSVAEELPIFLVIFAIPAVVAGFLWRKFARHP